MEIISHIELIIKTAFRDAFNIEVTDVFVEVPKDATWGDYATNVCMKYAKELKMAPVAISKALVDHLNLSKDPLFSEITFVAPGFVNFRLSDNFLLSSKHTIVPLTSGSERIALEHSNVNPNKAAHIGHLRNAVLGQFVERVYEALGYDVEVQYYVNDLGVQVVTSSMGSELIKDIKPDNYRKFDHYAWDIYSKMENMINEDPELAQKREQIMKKIEDINSPESVRQIELATKILKAQLETFSNLDIDYDILVHERDIIALKIWDVVFEELKTNSNVYKATEGKSEGCWLVKMDKNGSKHSSPVVNETSTDVEEDKIIVRSNGIPTYTGKDIAYHMWKFGLVDMDFYYKKVEYGTQEKDLYTTDYLSDTSSTSNSGISFRGAKKVFNVIDGKQTYAMEAVKNSLNHLGYKIGDTDMVHINYGFVYISPNTAKKLGIDVSEGKSRYGMSGRKGWGIKIDDLIEMLDQKLLADHGDSSSLKSIRNAAIKFEMLKYNTFQDVVFDLDAALDIKGFSGPYIQYTYARTQSILSKAGITTYVPEQFLTTMTNVTIERDILRMLEKYQHHVLRSALEFAPNILATYLFDLAQKYNTFYAVCPVLSEPDEALRMLRLYINREVGVVLSTGLFILGIDSPERV